MTSLLTEAFSTTERSSEVSADTTSSEQRPQETPGLKFQERVKCFELNGEVYLNLNKSNYPYYTNNSISYLFHIWSYFTS